MNVSFDPAKREVVLRERGLHVADVEAISVGFHLTRRDDRHSEAEERFISVGALRDEVVMVVWTEREGGRRIVTMWKANERERTAYHRQRERSG